MKRDLRGILISLLFVSLFSMIALGQETTGNIEITVKDTAGAVVPNVGLTVQSSGATTGFRRTVTTDDEGFVRILQVPPGVYKVTAAATAGFVEKILDQIAVSLGRTVPVVIELSTSATAVVDVNDSGLSPLDVTDTKVQTTISAATAELLPKGTNFTSILKISPATRPEPRSGQFQIDGASGSENTFIVDGLEVTNVRTGLLDANSALPFALIQEVQIKTSGFEAEYGGATGGVINLVTKGGGNQFTGEFGSQFRLSAFEPIGASILVVNASVPPQFYPNRRNHFSEFNPTFNLNGPILKDRVWFSVNYSPQRLRRERTIEYVQTGRIENYRFIDRREFTRGRIDAQPLEKLHLTATYNWNPIIFQGATPSFFSELGTPPTQPGTGGNTGVPAFDGAAYLNQTGGRQNSQNFSSQGVYTLTNNLLVTGRFGHYFLNEKIASYGGGDVTVPIITCSRVGAFVFPPGFGCTHTATIPPGPQPNGNVAISNTLFDATRRRIYEGDATYSFGLGGRHELKGGYQFNQVGNEVDESRSDIVSLRRGVSIGTLAGRSFLDPTPGQIGSGVLSLFATAGNVKSKNEGIYIQDKWQPTNRLTLNLGIRAEKEGVPSFAEGLPGINFDWASKLAPRLGAAYDLTGDGKTKVSAFYGLFHDRFKYELPRGSFGGDLFHSLFFEILPGDTIATFNRQTLFGDGGPVPGGLCPDQLAPIYGRIRCDVDFRVPSNLDGDPFEVGGIDPNIKPFRQSELTFTFERELWRRYKFAVRYSHKSVIRAIEDAGFPNSEGSEYYIIGNPGEGLHKEQSDHFGVIALKPIRKYDAVEFRFDRAFANNFFFNANYTWSRLFGNYSGLSSSDEDGRPSPGVNRFFDQPHAGFTVAGGPDIGLLATDRPHVFKFYGAYSFNWERLGFGNRNATDINLFTTASSGTLVTTFVNINNISQIILTKRGDQGRTPIFTQTDFALRHRYKFGRDNRFTFVAETDILNFFNEYNVTNIGLNPSGQGGNIISNANFDATNPDYNLITPAERTACAGNQQCLLIAAYRTFQQHGSPELLADAMTTSPNLYYNIPSTYQAKRIVRFGFRLVF